MLKLHAKSRTLTADSFRLTTVRRRPRSEMKRTEQQPAAAGRYEGNHV